MLRILMLKRGSAASLNNYRGAEGELVYDRTANTLRVHDGVRTGGYTMQRNALQIEIPSIVSPSNGAMGISRQITFTATPYSGAGNHTASRWMIYLDAARTELLHDSGWSASALTSYYFEAPSDTQLYVQVIYQVNGELTTPWSPLIVVRTAAVWLTYFTAFSQTSHTTSYSRTTSWTVNTSGSSSTYWNTSYSASRTTSMSTTLYASTSASHTTSWLAKEVSGTSVTTIRFTSYNTSKYSSWSTYIDPAYPGGGYKSTGVYTAKGTGHTTSWTTAWFTYGATKTYARTTYYSMSTAIGSTNTSWITSWSGSSGTARTTTKSWSTTVNAATADGHVTYYETSFQTAVYTS